MRLFAVIALFLAALVSPLPAAELEIDIIYDNTAAVPAMEADWGFAALVRFNGRNVLFDSGTKPDLFLRNLEKLHVDPKTITAAVLSHEHDDHCNGIYELFPKNPSMKVYFLDSFAPRRFEQAAAIDMAPVRVKGPREIVPGIFTTGQVDGPVAEQALVIETSKGVVVLTGCSHPGVVKMVETAERQRATNAVRLLAGGFHMNGQEDARVQEQIAQLKALRVERIIPTHCTGDRAIELFSEAYGDACEHGGAGKKIVLD